MTAATRILLAGSGWRREIGADDVRLLIERLRATDEWSLAHKLTEALGRGAELVLSLDEKRALFALLEGMRAVADLPSRLNLLCNDLDDDLYGYES